MRTLPLKACWLALALGAGISIPPASAAPASAVKAGDKFPDLGSFKLDGKLPDTTKAKVVMVDFWASWCAPCQESFPVMEELRKRYAERGLVVIGVCVDEDRSDMEDFLKHNKVAFAVVRDASQKLVQHVGVETMPTSFLIDREGKVRFTHTGYRGPATKKQYEAEIEELLK
jgi:thiol-disulfide isomerase/thioredoxin